MLCECVVGSKCYSLQHRMKIMLSIWHWCMGSISVRKGVSRLLKISLSTHKLLALPEWDQKNPGTAAEIFPVPPAPALRALAQHPMLSPSKITIGPDPTLQEEPASFWGLRPGWLRGWCWDPGVLPPAPRSRHRDTRYPAERLSCSACAWPRGTAL